VLNPEQRIGAIYLNDLYSHEYFKDIDFEKIKDYDPPSSKRISFKLSRAKKVQVNYLPKNIKHLQKKNSSSPKQSSKV
jgi:hypothetical protein